MRILLLMFFWQSTAVIPDYGLDYVRALALVEQPGWQATAEGYTFTITEAYADASRVVFTVIVDAPPGEGVTNLRLDGDLTTNAVERGRFLLDSRSDDARPDRRTFTASFRTTKADEPEPTPFDLTLTALRTNDPVAEVNFSAEILFREGVVLPLDDTVSASEIDLRLETVRVSRSMVTFDVCFSAPDDAWYVADVGHVITDLSVAEVRLTGRVPDGVAAGDLVCTSYFARSAYENGPLMIQLDEVSILGARGESITGPWVWEIIPIPDNNTAPVVPPVTTPPPAGEGPVPVG